mmetsp:Transcript_9459/g.25682  ORF Transcript_9459/g.25682 Transcript_9459/m.25682 type:complete len:294 (-) Transcript_9459:35-916(-)
MLLLVVGFQYKRVRKLKERVPQVLVLHLAGARGTKNLLWRLERDAHALCKLPVTVVDATGDEVLRPAGGVADIRALGQVGGLTVVHQLNKLVPHPSLGFPVLVALGLRVGRRQHKVQRHVLSECLADVVADAPDDVRRDAAHCRLDCPLVAEHHQLVPAGSMIGQNGPDGIIVELKVLLAVRQAALGVRVLCSPDQGVVQVQRQHLDGGLVLRMHPMHQPLWVHDESIVVEHRGDRRVFLLLKVWIRVQLLLLRGHGEASSVKKICVGIPIFEFRRQSARTHAQAVRYSYENV